MGNPAKLVYQVTLPAECAHYGISWIRVLTRHITMQYNCRLWGIQLSTPLSAYLWPLVRCLNNNRWLKEQRSYTTLTFYDMHIFITGTAYHLSPVPLIVYYYYSLSPVPLVLYTFTHTLRVCLSTALAGRPRPFPGSLRGGAKGRARPSPACCAVR